jgi:hypothetical protein
VDGGGRLHVPGGYVYSSAPHSAAAAAKGRGEGGGRLPSGERARLQAWHLRARVSGARQAAGSRRRFGMAVE